MGVPYIGVHLYNPYEYLLCIYIVVSLELISQFGSVDVLSLFSLIQSLFPFADELSLLVAILTLSEAAQLKIIPKPLFQMRSMKYCKAKCLGSKPALDHFSNFSFLRHSSPIIELARLCRICSEPVLNLHHSVMSSNKLIIYMIL